MGNNYLEFKYMLASSTEGVKNTQFFTATRRNNHVAQLWTITGWWKSVEETSKKDFKKRQSE